MFVVVISVLCLLRLFLSCFVDVMCLFCVVAGFVMSALRVVLICLFVGLFCLFRVSVFAVAFVWCSLFRFAFVLFCWFVFTFV